MKIDHYLHQFKRYFPTGSGHLPLVFSTSISDTKTLLVYIRRLGITCDLPLGKYQFSAPTESYISFLYIEDGSSRKGHRPSEPLKYHRGLTISEGIAMVTAWPEVLEDHAIDMIQSRYSIECVPTLYKWNNRIHLSAVCPDVQDAMCGTPIVKKEIRFTCEEWEKITDDQFQARLEAEKRSFRSALKQHVIMEPAC